MLLAIDIGNTNIVLGVFEGDALVCEARLHSDENRTRDEYEVLLMGVLDSRLAAGFDVDLCVVSSVVPQLTPVLVQVVDALFDAETVVVGPGIKTGLSINIDDPRTVGSDRVVNSVAAREAYGCPVLVVDFGTATTIDVIAADGSYHGGVIAPGLELSSSALVSHTAKLPRIELAFPSEVVGKSTVHAMQSGTVVGHVMLVDGLIRRIEDEIGPVKHVVATGGSGRLMAEHSECITIYDEHLTLKGLHHVASLAGVG